MGACEVGTNGYTVHGTETEVTGRGAIETEDEIATTTVTMTDETETGIEIVIVTATITVIEIGTGRKTVMYMTEIETVIVIETEIGTETIIAGIEAATESEKDTVIVIEGGVLVRVAEVESAVIVKETEGLAPCLLIGREGTSLSTSFQQLLFRNASIASSTLASRVLWVSYRTLAQLWGFGVARRGRVEDDGPLEDGEHRANADDKKKEKKEKKEKEEKKAPNTDGTDHPDPEIAEANRLRAALGLKPLRP